MKKVKMQKLSRTEKQNAINEIRILASVNHPNVIGYKEAFFDDSTNHLCIIMENADAGDLLSQVKQKKDRKETIGEKTIWHYLIQIVRGLKALHDLKICHRDIKCANIFLTKAGEAKLGDMNVSKVAKAGMLLTVTGTPYYACPEVWKNMPYDNKSDIWSLGCVLYEMCSGRPPFTGNSMKDLGSKVISGKYEQISSKYSQELKDVLKQCLQVQSSKRLTCDQILKLPCIVRHITETLDNIEARKDMPEKLLNTIRCPLNLNQITGSMPASNYSSVTKQHKSDQEQPESTKLSAMHAMKPMRDVTVSEAGKESSRVSSADSNSRLSTPATIKDKISKRRYLAANNDKAQVSQSTPDLANVNSKLDKVVKQTNDSVSSQLLQKDPVQFVNPNLGVIEEKEADEAGTGMDNIKVLLKAPQRKQMADPNLAQAEKP